MNRHFRPLKSLIGVLRSDVRLRPYDGPPEDIDRQLVAYYGSGASVAYYDKLRGKDKDDDWRDMSRRTRFVEICHNANRIIDFGCGVGNLVLSLARRYPDKIVGGIDIGDSSAWQMAAASDAMPGNVTFLRGDLRMSHLPDESFDLVVSRFVIEHVVYPERVISEMARVLTPGGCLYLVYPHLFLLAGARALFREIRALVGGRAEVTYLDPILEGEPCGDKDAAWLCNHWRLKRMLKSVGLTVTLDRPSESLLVAYRASN